MLHLCPWDKSYLWRVGSWIRSCLICYLSSNLVSCLQFQNQNSENQSFLFEVLFFYVCGKLMWQIPWTKCCVTWKFMLRPNPQCDDVRRWGLWETVRLWEWGHHDGISALERDPKTQKEYTVYEPGSPHQVSNWLILDFRPPELWEISVAVYKSPSRVVTAAWVEQDNRQTWAEGTWGCVSICALAADP